MKENKVKGYIARNIKTGKYLRHYAGMHGWVTSMTPLIQDATIYDGRNWIGDTIKMKDARSDLVQDLGDYIRNLKDGHRKDFEILKVEIDYKLTK